MRPREIHRQAAGPPGSDAAGWSTPKAEFTRTPGPMTSKCLHQLRRGIPVTLLLVGVACGEPDVPPPATQGAPPAAGSRDPSDSVAPVMVTSVSPGALVSVQRVTPSDAWFLVSGEVDGESLASLGRLTLLDNGDVLAVRGGVPELLILTPDESLRATIARGGDRRAAPPRFSDAVPCSPSRIAAHDGDGTLEFYRPDGALIEAVSLASYPEAPLRLVGADRGCSTFLVESIAPASPESPGRTAFGRRTLFLLEPGVDRLRPIDVPSRSEGRFLAQTARGPEPIPAPFGLGDEVAFGLDRSVIVIAHDRGEYVVHRPPAYAPRDTVRWTAAEVPERVAAWDELFERPYAAARERSSELGEMPPPAAFPVPSELPKSDRILVGQDGTVFVRLGQGRDRVFFADAERLRLPRERWIAFTPEGGLVGHYLLPRGHRLVGGGPGRELLVAGTDDAGLPLAYWVPAELPL